ncbi:MAG: chain-length determining protein [Myxococcaceae bacterium]|nr:chain-length determining protein [Myxococcaceae bacterium]
MEPVTAQKPESDDAEETAASPKELAQFVVRAVRENAAYCVAVGLLVGAIGATVVSALPQVYDATCKIFIQDGGTVTSSLASGRERNRTLEGARGLEEFILARDNLLSIVREAKLFERWPTTRPWPMRLKDEVTEYLFGPPERASAERGFVEMLALAITAAKDGESVRIHAQWRDKQSAYELTRLVERNFLAARAAHDLGPIQRAIPFLEQQVQEADQEIETAVNRFQKAKGSWGAEEPVKSESETAPAAAGGISPTELATLSRRLSEVRRQQRSLTEPRRRKVAELKMELIDMSASYAPDHPLVRQQEARIATLSEVPPELTELRDEEAKILSALSSRSGGKANALLPGKLPVVVNDPDLAASQARLASALRKSDESMAKLENARIELATAEADFKHRYIVVEEPDVPNAPLKPKKKAMLFGLVGFLTLLLGALAGVARELRKGRLVEPWQVRQLGLELLGEVELK